MHAVCRLLVILLLNLSILLQSFTAIPHVDERQILHESIPQTELDTLLEDAGELLGVRLDQFDESIRHNVVKKIVQDDPTFQTRGVTGIPLAVKRRSDNPDYLTWAGCDTILGEQVKNVNLLTETRVTKLHFDPLTRKVDGAILRDLNTKEDILVVAKVWCIYYLADIDSRIQ